ncbi:hypothetical protein SteCoe_2178 [Stentor coeruleus]|uniref:Kelch motif family protein n=1 Tax=Stentor coeruleus TaxID=5963 RepID=A0A1R2CZY3_9CILI|nr:hypothetical protein SteCoe_2178 [Stentor coeruleus]
MNNSCFSENCKIQVNKILYCQKNKLICCPYHEKEHKDLCTQASHKDKNLYQKVSSNTLKSTIAFLQQQICVIKDKKASFLYKIQSYIKQFNEISKQVVRELEITEKLCLWMLKCTIKTELFPTFLWPGRSSPIDSKYIINELFYHAKSYQNPKLNLSFDIVKTVEDSDFFLHNSENLEDLLYGDYLYIVTDQTKGIFKFNPDKMIYKNLFTKEGFIKGPSYSICQLPQRKLFINGGNKDNQRLSLTFIYDMRNKEFEKVNEISIPRHNTSATYYKDKVYIFGGNLNQNYFSERFFNGSTCDYADCFNLISKNWTNCQNMPQKSTYINVAVLNNKFVLIGEYNFAFIYFTLNDCYQNIPNEIITGQKTQTFANDEKVFVLGKYLYISTDVELYWNKLEIYLDYTKSCCKPIIKGEYAFFFDSIWNIYRFSCKRYSLEEVGRADSGNLNFN